MKIKEVLKEAVQKVIKEQDVSSLYASVKTALDMQAEKLVRENASELVVKTPIKK